MPKNIIKFTEFAPPRIPKCVWYTLVKKKVLTQTDKDLIFKGLQENTLFDKQVPYKGYKFNFSGILRKVKITFLDNTVLLAYAVNIESPLVYFDNIQTIKYIK